MTGSNKTYLNVRRNTTLALSLAGVAIVASGFLILQVNSLDRKYGRVEENLGYYTGELQLAQEQLESTRLQSRDLSDQNQNLLEKIVGAENGLQSARQREADALARLETIQSELTSVQGSLSEAQLTIAEAARLERENTQALVIKSDLETQVVNIEDNIKRLEERQRELEAQKVQSETVNARLDGRRDELQRNVDALMPTVENLRGQERRVAQLRDDETRLEDRIDELTGKENISRNELVALTVQIDAERQRLSEREQELTTAQTRLTEFQAELEELQARKTALEVNVSDAQSRYSQLQTEADFAQSALARIQAQRTEVIASFNRAQEQLSTAQAQLTTLETQIAAALRELEDVNQRRAEFDRLQTDVDRLQARKSELENVLPDLVEKVDNARSTFASTQADADAELERLAGLNGRASSLETEIKRLQDRRDALQVTTGSAQVAADEAGTKLQNLQVELGKVNAELTTLKTQFASALVEIGDVNQRRAEFDRLQADVDRLQARKSELENVLPDLVEKVDNARSTFASTRADADAELERLAGLNGRASSLETEIKRLQDRRDALQVTTGSAQVAAEVAGAQLQNLQVELGKVDARVQANTTGLSQLDEQIANRKEYLDMLKKQIEEAEAAMAPAGSGPSDEVK